MKEVVIRISDTTYDAIIHRYYIAEPKGLLETLINAVKKGRALPKGHGDLIDVDTIVWDEEYEMVSDGSYIAVRTPIIDTAITVIKADKEERK